MANTSVNLNRQSTFNSRDYVMTPSGMLPGTQRGLMRGDETIIDTYTGQSSIPSGANPSVVGTSTDSVPVGEPGTFTGGGVFDRSSILGSKVDKENPYGLTFLQQAWGPAKLREQLKLDTMIKLRQARFAQAERLMQELANNNNSRRDNNTKKFVAKQLERRYNNIIGGIQESIARNQQYDAAIGEHLLDLADRQEMQYGNTADENGQIKANCGKSAKYAWGKGSFSPFLGLATTVPYLIRETSMASGNQPTRQYEFTSNPNAQSAADALSRLRYDNTADMLDLIRTERKGLYGIKQAGNLSTGQRRALANDLVTRLFDKRAALRQQAQQMNNQYATAAAEASYKAGADYAHAMQQARHNENEAYARAVGAKQQLDWTNNKNWYTGLMGNIRDWDTFNWRNAYLDLYDKQVKADTEAVKPTTTVANNSNWRGWYDILPKPSFINYIPQYRFS